MKPKVCFFTVCGGGQDYEFLLGAIEHHAKLGNHLVLDTTPAWGVREFRNLPRSVCWIHAPNYGAGWKNFRYVSALRDAVNFAENIFKDADVLVQLDSDDFFSPDAEEAFATSWVGKSVVELQYVHWLRDGYPYIFGESEWHRRIWPARRGVRYEPDPSWSQTMGSEETHPKLWIPDGMRVWRIEDLCRHHLHFAIGSKAKDDEIARSSVTGWPNGGTKVYPSPWPAPLQLWRDRGELPSRRFE